MLVEDQAFDFGIGVEDIRGLAGEAEAGAVVGHEAQAAAVDLAGELGAIGLVDQGEDGIGVGVIDIRVRHEGMQQELHRWVRRQRIEQVGALHAHHVLIAQVVERAQLLQTGRA